MAGGKLPRICGAGPSTAYTSTPIQVQRVILPTGSVNKPPSPIHGRGGRTQREPERTQPLQILSLHPAPTTAPIQSTQGGHTGACKPDQGLALSGRGISCSSSLGFNTAPRTQGERVHLSTLLSSVAALIFTTSLNSTTALPFITARGRSMSLNWGGHPAPGSPGGRGPAFSIPAPEFQGRGFTHPPGAVLHMETAHFAVKSRSSRKALSPGMDGFVHSGVALPSSLVRRVFPPSGSSGFPFIAILQGRAVSLLTTPSSPPPMARYPWSDTHPGSGYTSARIRAGMTAQSVPFRAGSPPGFQTGGYTTPLERAGGRDSPPAPSIRCGPSRQAPPGQPPRNPGSTHYPPRGSRNLATRESPGPLPASGRTNTCKRNPVRDRTSTAALHSFPGTPSARRKTGSATRGGHTTPCNGSSEG